MIQRIYTLLLVLLAIPTFLFADDIRVNTKKIPVPNEAPAEIPKHVNLKDAERRWSCISYWRSLTTGVNATFNTPEVIAGLTTQQAKAKFLNEKETQALWEDNIKKGWQESVSFTGWIQLNTAQYDRSEIDADWEFVLFTEDGKRIRPSQVVFGDVTLSRTIFVRNNHWKKPFTVRFDNKDADTGKPIRTPETNELTLGVGGKPGSIKTKFVFDQKKKR